MGYYKVIRPKDNFEKFRTTANKWNFTEYIKKYILYDCMSFNKDGKEVKDMDISNFLFNLEKNIDNLVRNCIYDSKVSLTKEFDTENGSWSKKGEIVFCGWEYAEDKTDSDIDETKEYVLDKLFVIATLSKRYDYFEDSEMFYKKQNEIEELLDYLKEKVEKCVDFEVIEYYKDCVVDDDDEDDEDEENDEAPKEIEENADSVIQGDVNDEEIDKAH